MPIKIRRPPGDSPARSLRLPPGKLRLRPGIEPDEKFWDLVAEKGRALFGDCVLTPTQRMKAIEAVVVERGLYHLVFVDRR